MNPERWDEIALRFERGDLLPAAGVDAWERQAARESKQIRAALPDGVRVLVEVGCGVARLTPFLAVQFPIVRCTDTSAQCRRITRMRCSSEFSNVEVMDSLYPPGDAAVVWGCLYDADWSHDEASAHLGDLINTYPIVLLQTAPRSRLALEFAEHKCGHGDDWVTFAPHPFAA